MIHEGSVLPIRSVQVGFRPRGVRPRRAAIEAWLVARPWWQLGAERASYYDPSTDVYFGLDWLDDDAPAPMRFELELCLPESFAHEAVPEVAALAEAFSLDTVLPGRDPSPFDPERFLADWREANAQVCAAQVGELDTPYGTLPRASNLAIQAWNRCREAYGERLWTVEMLPCLPPPVRLMVPYGDRSTVLTAVIWTAAQPIVLPEVDVVLAMEAPDLAPQVIPHVALRPWLDRFPRREAGHRFGRSGVIHACGLPHWIVDYDTPPAGLEEALRSLGTRRRLVTVAPHEVLDRETVRAARERFVVPTSQVTPAS